VSPRQEAGGRVKRDGGGAEGINFNPSVPFSGAVTVDPSGRYAYVANQGGNNVSQYAIGTDGNLTAMTPATVAADGKSIAVITTGSWR